MHVARVDTARCVGGESPVWDPREHALYFLDNFGQRVHRFDPVSGVTRTWDVPGIVTALALCESPNVAIALPSGVHTLALEDGSLTQVCPMPAGSRFGFNDGAVDRQGRFVLGGSTSNAANPQPDGGLFRVDPDGRITQLDSGVHYSNGPCWSPDEATLYFSDSWLKTIYAYDYDPQTGDVANRRVFATTVELGGVPDGATVDSNGRLWVAVYQSGTIACFTPDGHLQRTVQLPVSLVSSVTFGGARLDQLFVTTIDHDNDESGAAGLVYVVEDLDARGLPESRFAG